MGIGRTICFVRNGRAVFAPRRWGSAEPNCASTRGACRVADALLTLRGAHLAGRGIALARPPCKPFVLHHNGSTLRAAYNSNHKGEPIWLRCRISFLAFGSTAEALEAAELYISLVAHSHIGQILRLLIDTPGAKATVPDRIHFGRQVIVGIACGRKGPVCANVVIEVTIASTREVDLKDKFELHRDIVRVAEYIL